MTIYRIVCVIIFALYKKMNPFYRFLLIYTFIFILKDQKRSSWFFIQKEKADKKEKFKSAFWVILQQSLYNFIGLKFFYSLLKLIIKSNSIAYWSIFFMLFICCFYFKCYSHMIFFFYCQSYFSYYSSFLFFRSNQAVISLFSIF